jgi:hypothetical protein
MKVEQAPSGLRLWFRKKLRNANIEHIPIRIHIIRIMRFERINGFPLSGFMHYRNTFPLDNLDQVPKRGRGQAKVRNIPNANHVLEFEGSIRFVIGNCVETNAALYRRY